MRTSARSTGNLENCKLASRKEIQSKSEKLERRSHVFKYNCVHEIWSVRYFIRQVYHTGGRGGGARGTSIWQEQGCWLEILKRTPDPVLWAWLEFFSPLKGINITSTFLIFNIVKDDCFEYIPLEKFFSCHFYFGLNTLNCTAKAPAVDPVRLNIPRGMQFSFYP